MDASEVCAMANDGLRAVGLLNDKAVFVDEWYEDEDCRGYVEVDGLVIYPHKFDDGSIGWGVAGSACIPGCHTMPNGDPGYPDETEVIDIALPYLERTSIVGPKRWARGAFNAVNRAIEALVNDRVERWVYGPEE